MAEKLKKGSTENIIFENIAELRRHKHSIEDAAEIAFDKAKVFKQKHAHGNIFKKTND